MNLTEKQEFESKLYTGFSMMELLLLNPTTEERGELFGYVPKTDAKPQLYEGRTPEGDDYVDIVVYVKMITHPDKPIMTHRFRFVDKDVVSEKEEDGVKTTKYQFVNQQGMTSWCDSEKNLLEKFTKIQKKTYVDKVLTNTENIADSQYRKAIVGEGQFYNFFQAWIDGVAYTGESAKETDIFIDKKKMFRNIDKYVESEFKPLIKDKRAKAFNGLATVGISEKDDKVNHFQNLYSEFWPDGKNSGWKFKGMLTSINTGDWTINENTIKAHDYFVKQLKKNIYTLGWISICNPNAHIQGTNETFKPAAESSNDINDANY